MLRRICPFRLFLVIGLASGILVALLWIGAVTSVWAGGGNGGSTSGNSGGSGGAGSGTAVGGAGGPGSGGGFGGGGAAAREPQAAMAETGPGP